MIVIKPRDTVFGDFSEMIYLLLDNTSMICFNRSVNLVPMDLLHVVFERRHGKSMKVIIWFVFCEFLLVHSLDKPRTW